jgi:hypothetical protein
VEDRLEGQGHAVLSALEEFCAWTAADYAGQECYLADPSQTGALPGWREAVQFGRGFVLLRRLAIETLGESEALEAFARLAGQFGTPTEPARMLSGAEIAFPLASLGADLSAFACLGAPPSGLTISLSNGVSLHNTLLCEAEDTVARLCLAEDGSLPIFRRRGHKLSVRLDPGACKTTPRGKAARLALARAEANALQLELEPGDLLLVNNHHILTGSTAREGRLLIFSLRAQLMAVQSQAAGEAGTAAANGASRAA